MNCEALFTARFNPHAFMPGDGMADARLRTSRCNHHRIAEGPNCGYQGLKSGGVDAVVIGEEELHGTWN